MSGGSGPSSPPGSSAARGVRVVLAGASADPPMPALVVEPWSPGVEASEPAPGLEAHDPGHMTLRLPDGTAARVLILPGARVAPPGALALEVGVDGWRFEVQVDDADRAALRERGSRTERLATDAQTAEVRAIIPGRIASVAVTAGQAVSQGDPLLVIEAMKMQNELRAPRAGIIARIAVAAGRTVEAGDLLVVME